MAAAAPVAVLSHDYWRTRLNGDPTVLGEALLVNGHALTIVGVAPAGFDGTTLGFRPAAFMPFPVRALIEPGGATASSRTGAFTGSICSAASRPACRMAQAQRRAQRALPAHPRRGRGAAAHRRERPDARSVHRQADRRHRRIARPEPPARHPEHAAHAAPARGRAWCCSSPAPTSPTCSWPGPRPAPARWPCGCRLAAAAGSSCASCSSSRACWPLAGGAAGLLVARWTLQGIATLLPATADDMALTFALDWPAMLFGAALTIGAGLLFGLAPALQGHASRHPVHPEGPVGPAVGRQVQRAAALGAVHGADRPGDGAARVGGPVRAQPGQRQQRSARPRPRTARDVCGRARAERLLARWHAGLRRTPRDRSGRHSRRHLGLGLAHSRAGEPQQRRQPRGRGFHHRPRRRHQRAHARRRRRPSSAPWACRCWPAGRSRRPTPSGAPRVAIVNEAFARKFNLGRESRRPAPEPAWRRGARHRDRRPGARRQVQRREGRGAGRALRALSPERRTSSRCTSTCARRCRPSRCWRRCRAWCGRSTRACPCATW